MREGLQKIIKEILISEKKVIVPGFGTFVSEPEPAFLERIKGGMMPPGEKVSFIPDKTIQDNRLQAVFSSKYQLQSNEVEELIQANVELYWKALEENDVISFPGIGNVYLDYQNKIQFIQESSNVSGDYFGLPKLQLENQPPVPAAQTVEMTPGRFQEGQTDISNNVQKTTKRDYQTLALYGIAVLAFLLAGSLAIKYYILDPMKEENILRSNVHKKSSYEPITDSDFEQLDSVREIKAEKTSGEPEYQIFKDDKRPQSQRRTATNQKQTEPKEPVSTPPASPKVKETANKIAPAQKESTIVRKAVVIINAFENEASATKFITKLNKKDYVPYSDTKGKLTRVGVEIQYQSKTDLDHQLAVIKKELNKDAWLLFK